MLVDCPPPMHVLHWDLGPWAHLPASPGRSQSHSDLSSPDWKGAPRALLQLPSRAVRRSCSSIRCKSVIQRLRHSSPFGEGSITMQKPSTFAGSPWASGESETWYYPML